MTQSLCPASHLSTTVPHTAICYLSHTVSNDKSILAVHCYFKHIFNTISFCCCPATKQIIMVIFIQSITSWIGLYCHGYIKKSCKMQFSSINICSFPPKKRNGFQKMVYSVREKTFSVAMVPKLCFSCTFHMPHPLIHGKCSSIREYIIVPREKNKLKMT